MRVALLEGRVAVLFSIDTNVRAMKKKCGISEHFQKLKNAVKMRAFFPRCRVPKRDARIARFAVEKDANAPALFVSRVSVEV